MAAADSLPGPRPVIWPETAPFWSAAQRGRLALPRCPACRQVIWYPKGVCPTCMGTDLEWFDAAGVGTVFSFTVVRRGAGAYAASAPYIVALVELAEGPRIFSNVVGADAAEVFIGAPVVVTFEYGPDPSPEDEESVPLPRFRLATSDERP